MKVVHMMSGDLWAGAEVQAFTLLRELRKSHEIELAAIALNEGRLAQRLRELDMRVHVVDEQRIGPLGILREVKGILKEERGDILHTHRYKENVIGGRASRSAGPMRRVKTVHGLPEPFTSHKSLRSALAGLLDRYVTRRYFDRVICVSEDMVKHLARAYGREKLVCIRNGIEVSSCVARTSRAEVRTRLGIPADGTVMGSAARLVRIKGFDHLLHAAKNLAPSVPNLFTVIVGDGPEMQNLQNRAKQLGISDRVIFTGHRDDAHDLIAAMDLFVLPSLSEGIPMVLLEAMALGTPIVATRVGGVPEVVTNGVTGLLVGSGDPAQLAGAGATMITDRAFATKLATQARHAVEREHSAAAMAREVMALYERLVAAC